MNRSAKPHAVCVPFPLTGHIDPTLKFAKLLHHRGFHVTFVNTDFNHKRILDSGGPSALDGLPEFRFETVAIGSPPLMNTASPQYLLFLRESIRKNFLSAFRSLLAKLNNDSTSSTANAPPPPVTCIISDGMLTHCVTAAEELGIPTVLLTNMGAGGFMKLKHYRNLLGSCLAPIKDVSGQNEALDTIVDWIPGIKSIRVRDIPNLIQTKDQKDYIIDFTVGEEERASKASAMVIHTFEALERDVLDAIAMSSSYRRVYSIGPLSSLINQISEHSLKSIGCNLWKQENECVQWLNSKEPNSVIYVNFGSIAVVTPKQLVELAWGLANSNHCFLWIIRPDLIIAESEALLPDEFVAQEAKERGLIASWCEQEQVLNHPSVGGFLTHCGWNSTLESICAGVPIICWPFFGEHVTNCRNCCDEWGIGVEIDKDVKRENVEKLVRELMDGERGKKMKNKATEWKTMAAEATGPLGSSSVNLDKLVNEVLLSKIT